MSTTPTDRRAAFRALHADGYFILPNPWDAGTARLFEGIGFKALASTSTGYAWTTGRPDYAVTKADVVAHLKTLCDAVDIPVNADFESGFASEPEGVAANVREAITTGIAGLSIEDRVVGDLGKLYDTRASVDRIKAAKVAIQESGHDVVLVARTERLLIDPTATKQAIDTLVALADAGADCLYAPGAADKETIGAMVRAVAPKSVNVLAMGPTFPGLTVAELADLGVRRISVGGALSLVGWASVKRAAQNLFDGSFDGLADSIPGQDLNTLFEKT